MDDISQKIDILANKMANKYCSISDHKKCEHDYCVCRVSAEIRAYMETIIPEPYYEYTIKNFKGKDNNGSHVLTDEILINAKKKLIEYCWDGVDISTIDNFSIKQLNDMSIIDKRRENGNNVIIYADDNVWTENKIKGKTFIASLIMKEVIKRRIIPGNNIQTYEWVTYSKLIDMLKNDDLESSYLKSSDWIVIDDIIRSNASRRQMSYFSSLIESLISGRLSSKLPTIFIFRFDIKKNKQFLPEEFGISITKILENNKTFIIPLVS